MHAGIFSNGLLFLIPRFHILFLQTVQALSMFWCFPLYSSVLKTPTVASTNIKLPANCLSNINGQGPKGKAKQNASGSRLVRSRLLFLATHRPFHTSRNDVPCENMLRHPP